ncbi:hypothetical protein [Thermocatellispora tengchongensis]|uniref:hypothetical protein n=1 Tax=Thermocatellispora tengchongensis TaxID=1073253 RepID=UPI0036304FF2
MTEPNGSFEVACDESGSEGEKLVGGNTDVFAHAGIRLTTALAARCVEETRARAPSPTVEYKSDVIRRAKHRAALVWLLGPSGPLHGNAHVYLIDKTFLVVTRLAGLLPEADPHVVHRQGRRALGDARWTAFLAAFNDLLRAGPVGIRNGRGPRPSAEAVFHLVDGLPYLRRAMPGAAALRAQLRTDPGALPALDPLVPAILQAAAHWGRASRSRSSTTGRPCSPTTASPASAPRPGRRWPGCAWWTPAPTPGCRWPTCSPARHAR